MTSKIAIVGGTGYTGAELIRVLSQHPQVSIAAISSRSLSGTPLTEHFPHMATSWHDNLRQLTFTEPDVDLLKQCAFVFFATPHGVAMSMAEKLLEAGVKIIDLAADFRLKDLDTWQHWYGMKHTAPHLMSQVAYGLPELWRDKIRQANIIANPGCYPTAIMLALAPLLKGAVIDLQHTVIIDAKSGVTGAGRTPKTNLLFSELNDSFTAYGLGGHRHHPEIVQGIETLAQDKVRCVFAPHLVPMSRGMEATIYLQLKAEHAASATQTLLETAYCDEPFVQVMPAGALPTTGSVRGSNLCRIGWATCPSTGTLIISSVIDNLVKGAVGQAVQNMNLLLGCDETIGLNINPLSP